MTTISFEFFPPKTMAASFRLWETVHALAPLKPEFVSVTYGAGGTTRALTHEAVREIGKMTGLNVAAHLTCVDATREETLAIAKEYAEIGVKRIVALRGDPPDGQSAFTPHPEGFADSCALISALAGTGDFDITVGAYPDKHPEAASADADLAWLKRKVDAGATSAITQFFFEAETFLRFRDRVQAAGIDVPVMPGVLPVENWQSTRNFASRCGAVIPSHVAEAFDRAERDDRLDLFATVHATDMCSTLVDEGVDHLHFYTLNRPSLTRDVISALGLAPPVALGHVA